jgi:hypothetical protein
VTDWKSHRKLTDSSYFIFCDLRPKPAKNKAFINAQTIPSVTFERTRLEAPAIQEKET